MDLYAYGNVIFSSPVSDLKFQKLIKELDIGEWIASCTRTRNDTLELGYSQVGSDLNSVLDIISEFAKENDLTIDGGIKYEGDYEGYCVFDDSAEYQEFSVEEYGVFAQTDIDILDTLRRRKEKGKLLEVLQMIKEKYPEEWKEA